MTLYKTPFLIMLPEKRKVARCQLLMHPDWLDVYLLLSLGSSERSLSERTVHFLCYMVKTDFENKLRAECQAWTLPLRAVYSGRWKCARLRRVEKSSGGTDAEGWVRLSCCFGDNPREKKAAWPFLVLRHECKVSLYRCHEQPWGLFFHHLHSDCLHFLFWAFS